MKIKVIAFGIAKDILQARETEMVLQEASTIKDLKAALFKQYPDFKALASLSFAVDEHYQDDYFLLSDAQEVVIIPPVAGG